MEAVEAALRRAEGATDSTSTTGTAAVGASTATAVTTTTTANAMTGEAEKVSEVRELVEDMSELSEVRELSELVDEIEGRVLCLSDFLAFSSAQHGSAARTTACNRMCTRLQQHVHPPATVCAPARVICHQARQRAA